METEETANDFRYLILSYLLLVAIGTILLVITMFNSNYNILTAVACITISVVMISLVYWLYRGNESAWFLSVALSVFYFVSGILEILIACRIIPIADSIGLEYGVADTILGVLMIVMLVQGPVRRHCNS